MPSAVARSIHPCPRRSRAGVEAEARPRGHPRGSRSVGAVGEEPLPAGPTGWRPVGRSARPRRGRAGAGARRGRPSRGGAEAQEPQGHPTPRRRPAEAAPSGAAPPPRAVRRAGDPRWRARPGAAERPSSPGPSRPAGPAREGGRGARTAPRARRAPGRSRRRCRQWCSWGLVSAVRRPRLSASCPGAGRRPTPRGGGRPWPAWRPCRSLAWRSPGACRSACGPCPSPARAWPGRP